MWETNLIGIFAGFLTTVSLIPQLIQLYRSRCATDISLGMYVIYSAGVLLWLIYGISRSDFPITLWNAIALVLACTVLLTKVIFDRQKLKSEKSIHESSHILRKSS